MLTTYATNHRGNTLQARKTPAVKRCRELRREGRHPYLIPVGGGLYYIGIAESAAEAKRLGSEAEAAAQRRHADAVESLYRSMS